MVELVAHSDPYPSDSLRWVAAEVRIPPSPDLAQSVPTALRDYVRPQFPVLDEEARLNVVVGTASPQQVLRRRFLTRDRVMSLTFSKDGVTLETTQYAGWSNFRGVFVAALEELSKTARPDGILRVGLRYIDEIRIPQPPASPIEWAGWVAEGLIAPFALHDPHRLSNAMVLLQYGEQPGFATTFRASPFPRGRTVLPQGALRLPVETPEDAYFLFDTDSSWSDPERKVPEFDAPFISSLLDQLHEPCVALFEASITDKLRAEVLRRPRAPATV
ncbi:MAG: TIGR04255 family protein [Candidatus Dormibacteria bacterium]